MNAVKRTSFCRLCILAIALVGYIKVVVVGLAADFDFFLWETNWLQRAPAEELNIWTQCLVVATLILPNLANILLAAGVKTLLYTLAVGGVNAVISSALGRIDCGDSDSAEAVTVVGLGSLAILLHVGWVVDFINSIEPWLESIGASTAVISIWHFVDGAGGLVYRVIRFVLWLLAYLFAIVLYLVFLGLLLVFPEHWVAPISASVVVLIEMPILWAVVSRGSG